MPADQPRIAEQALRAMFGPTFALIPIDEAQIRLEVAGSLAVSGVQTAKDILRRATGRRNEIDPFEQADGTAWIIVSNVLSQLRLSSLALDFALEYLGLCYELQEVENSRMSKGAPHFWVSARYEELGDTEASRAHMLLAFVEDIQDHHPNAKAAPAYAALITKFGVSGEELGKLESFADRVVGRFPPFPEEILVRYQVGAGWEGD